MKLYPLLCCLFSVLLALPTNHGEVQSVTNSLLHMEWVEEIVLTNWRYGEELALYEINGYANREDIVSIQEERLPLLMELDFNMFGLESSQLRLYNMIQHFLSAIRINFGSKIEFSGIWFYSKGYLGRDEVVSLISERRTLQHAAHRFLDLIEMDATEFDADYRRAICNRFSSGLTNVSLFLDALAMRYTDLCAEGHDDILLEAGALFDELVIVPLSTETSELDSAVDALLLKPFLQHYQEISLDQYLRHRFCQDLAINRSVTTTSVLNRASTSIYRDGVGVVNGLYVVDHPLDMAWDWDAEVAVAASFLSVPPSIPSSSSCSLRIRALYA